MSGLMVVPKSAFQRLSASLSTQFTQFKQMSTVSKVIHVWAYTTVGGFGMGAARGGYGLIKEGFDSVGKEKATDLDYPKLAKNAFDQAIVMGWQDAYEGSSLVPLAIGHLIAGVTTLSLMGGVGLISVLKTYTAESAEIMRENFFKGSRNEAASAPLESITTPILQAWENT